MPDTAGSSWLQWAHCRTQPISQVGGTSVITYLKRTKCSIGEWGVKKRKNEKQSYKRQGQRRRCSMQILPCSPCKRLQRISYPHCSLCKYKWLFPEERCSLCKPMQEQVYPEGLQPVRRTHTRAGEKCQEEGAAERSCYGLTTTPIPHACHAAWGWVGR